MRTAFSTAIVRFAQANPNVLLLTGDHGYALFDAFRKECPTQYVNAGIAEQNMVGISAGLARAGFIPFVYGLSSFIPIRVVEQIKIDIAHDALPVILIGDGAGVVYSYLGTTHQSTEDIACTRAIPNLTVMSPADRFELTYCMEKALSNRGPVYLRMGKADLGDVHQNPLVSGSATQALQVRHGVTGDITMLATGAMVRTAIDVANGSFPSADVWSIPFIKPIDAIQINHICSASKGVVVLEEHSVIGGLGSAIAEIVTNAKPVRVLRIGVADRFSEFCGTYDYLLREHGLDARSVCAQIGAFVATLG